jgi:hypothetical protein
MVSKLERWKKLSTSSKEHVKNPNKGQIFDDLATFPDTKEKTDDTLNVEPQGSSTNDTSSDSVRVENTSNTPTLDSNIQSTNSTLIDGVQNVTTNPDSKPNKPKQDKKKEQGKPTSVSLTKRVNDAILTTIENKVTQRDTHNRTSFQITYTNLAKLERFDEEHGGRQKTLFINNLLESAFAELEEDPTWHKILNEDLDTLIEKLKARR